MSKRRRSRILTYEVAVLAILAAVAMRILWRPVLGNDSPFLFFFAALVLFGCGHSGANSNSGATIDLKATKGVALADGNDVVTVQANVAATLYQAHSWSPIRAQASGRASNRC